MSDELRKETDRLCKAMRSLGCYSPGLREQCADHIEVLHAEIDRLRAELAEQWEPSGDDYDRSIHHNPDAAAWAGLFMQTFPNCGADRDTMLGWFANAIMSMYDSKIAPVEAERDRAMQACEQMGQQLAERDDLVSQFRAQSPEHDRLYREEKAKVDAAEALAALDEMLVTQDEEQRAEAYNEVRRYLKQCAARDE